MSPQTSAEVRDLQPAVARWALAASMAGAAVLAVAAVMALAAGIRTGLAEPAVWAATPSGSTIRIEPLAGEVARAAVGEGDVRSASSQDMR